MTHLQAGILVVEVGVISVSYLVSLVSGVVRRPPTS